MGIKPLDQINDFEELMHYSNQIVEKTPVDSAFSASVHKLLALTLNLVLGYEIYGLNEEREDCKKESEAHPEQIINGVSDLDWCSIATDLLAIIDNFDYYPMQKRPPFVEDSLLYKEKIQYMISYVGSQIFEEYFKEGFIYQVGNFAESEGYNLLRLLPDNDNTLLTSFKTSLFQMSEIVDSIDN